MAARPKVVVWFETLSIVVLAGDLILASGLDWSDLLWMPIMLWIILSISRRGSRLARWAFTGTYALGAGVLALLLMRGLLMVQNLSAVGWAMTLAFVVEVGLLWSPSMSEWIASKRHEQRSLTN